MAHRIELAIVEPADKVQTFSINLGSLGDECVVGRSRDCGVTLDDDMTAPRHCRLFVSDKGLMVENLDDEIGTCLNGEFLAEPCALPARCELLVGATLLRVRVTRDDASGETTQSEVPEVVRNVVTPAVDAPAGRSAPVAPPSTSNIETTPSGWAAPTRGTDDSATRDESLGFRKEATAEPAVGPAASEAVFEEPTPTPTPVTRREHAASVPSPAPSDTASDVTPPSASSSQSESGTSKSWARAMTYSPDASLVDRIERDLREEFSSNPSVRDASALRSLIQRGVERAKGYGLEEEEHVYQFLRCMVMLDDEIDGRNPDTEDVWLTISHAKRPAAQRIERAVKIASRLASERSGSRSRAARAPSRPSPSAPAAPIPAAAPAAFDVSPSQGYSRAGRTNSLTDADVTADPERSSATHATRGTPPPPPDAAAAEDSLPEIPGFAIKEEIGSGGMGRVFLAYDTQLDKDVAIKVLRSVDPESQEQLQHEARAAAKLEHPNIVQVARFEKLGRGGYYIMQFVRGLDGSKLVKRFESKAAHQLTGDAVLATAGVDPKRSPAELRELLLPDKNAYYRLVAYWVAGVADGLERAHSEGVLHRDIKPSNLLLSSDGRMMITDFGLAARPADRQGIGRARVGTPRYLSPERVADWASFSDEVQLNDARADVWSLGAVLYEFLVYRPAFRGTVAEVLRDIVTEAPGKPSTLVWSVPEILERICLQAMARRPDDRFMKAGDMGEALRGWLRVEMGVERKGRIPFLT